MCIRDSFVRVRDVRRVVRDAALVVPAADACPLRWWLAGATGRRRVVVAVVADARLAHDIDRQRGAGGRDLSDRVHAGADHLAGDAEGLGRTGLEAVGRLGVSTGLTRRPAVRVDLGRGA